jgi:L-threonylcarbamoyladenylate synthase
MNVLSPTSDVVARAAGELRAGRLVAFPTETVYGLGADAGNADAVRAIFAVKGRPADHPVIVHVSDEAQLAHWARDIPPGARRLAEAFWPGPLTLILPRSAHASDLVTGGQDRIGLRMPSHPVALRLLRAFAKAGGAGVAAPSANRFGRLSPTTAQHVADDFPDDVAMILDGGACTIGIESTIVAFGDGEPMLLRPGGIPATEVARVLGHAPRAPDEHAPRASGTLASHYAPRTPSRLVPARELAGELAAGAGATAVAVLARTVARPEHHGGKGWITAARDAPTYAHDLYTNLRALDATNATAILIESVPEQATWQAVRDRLARATRADDDDRD